MKKILMKIIESSNKALKEGDMIKAMVSVEKPTSITVVKQKRRKPSDRDPDPDPVDTKPTRNCKPPLWFQLWSDNVFVPFQKEVRETLARHEAKLNEIDEFKTEVRETFKRNAIKFEEFKKQNNLK
jgi:hypothetical protein